MKISIITAVYNGEKTIACALDSIQKQSYNNIEHIIIDGGSTDTTLSIINSKSVKNMKVKSEKDNGIADAYNKGIHLASGDIVGILNADDFYANDAIIEKVAKAFDSSAVDAVYGDLDYVSANEITKVIRHWKSNDYNTNKVKQGWMPPHPTLFLRKKVYNNFGLYNTNYKVALDYEAIVRYLLIGKIHPVYIPEVFVKMRMGGVSNGSLKTLLKKNIEDYKTIRTYQIGGVITLAKKNLSKISQFFFK